MPIFTKDFANLDYFHVVVVAIVGFAFGALWYSPVLFLKAWVAEMKLAGDAEPGGGGPARMLGAFLCTLVSTTVLAVLVVDHRSHGVVHGAELGLLVGAGLVAARQGVTGIFERRSLRLFLISAGHDVVLCVLQAAILTCWVEAVS
jgi:hypothetical protein